MINDYEDGRRKYDWDRWLDTDPDEEVDLTQGVHFDCTIESMKQQVRNAARASGLFVKIKQLNTKTFRVTTRRNK